MVLSRYVAKEKSMKRIWPIIAVADVPKSSVWYMTLLDAQNNHPGATVFEQILDKDGTIRRILTNADGSIAIKLFAGARSSAARFTVQPGIWGMPRKHQSQNGTRRNDATGL